MKVLQLFTLLLVFFLLLINVVVVPNQAESIPSETEIFITNDNKAQLENASETSSKINDVAVIMQNLIQNLVQSIPGLSQNTEEVLTELTNHIVLALETFTTKLLHASDELLGGIVNQLLSQLGEFEHLIGHVNKDVEWAITQLNETLMNHTEVMELWAANIKKDLRTINDTKLYKNGCQIVDSFIQDGTEKLKKCCNITIKPMRFLCRSMRTLLAEVFSVLAHAIDRIQSCIEDKNSYLEYMMPCVNMAADDVSAVLGKATELRQKMSAILPVKILYSRCCISVVLVEVERGRQQVENDIFKKSYNNYNNDDNNNYNDFV